MKKLFMIFCLSLFTLSLNASGSVSAPCSENLPSATEDEELIVRPNPCPNCGSHGWKLIKIDENGIHYFECWVCGYPDKA